MAPKEALVFIVTCPNPQGKSPTVLLRELEATVKIIVVLVIEIADGAVSEPALTHNPCVPWVMVKSEVTMLPEVKVVPDGKVSVMVLPEVIAVAGVKIAKLVIEAGTYVPTTLPEGP